MKKNINTNSKGISLSILVFFLLLSGRRPEQLFKPTITPTPTIVNTPTLIPTDTPTSTSTPSLTPVPLTMSDTNFAIWPAICSAIAAIFSATSAIVLLIIQIRNRKDSVRQEIILDDWTFDIDSHGIGNIHVKKIANVGKGPALHLSGWLELQGAESVEAGAPFVGLLCEPISILPPEKELEINWNGRFPWKGKKIDDMVLLKLTVTSYDIHDRRHKTTYQLLATDSNVAGTIRLSDGLRQLGRSTIVTRRQTIKGFVMNSLNRIKQNILKIKIIKKSKKKKTKK